MSYNPIITFRPLKLRAVFTDILFHDKRCDQLCYHTGIDDRCEKYMLREKIYNKRTSDSVLIYPLISLTQVGNTFMNELNLSWYRNWYKYTTKGRNEKCNLQHNCTTTENYIVDNDYLNRTECF